jgi:hypothetical protein
VRSLFAILTSIINTAVGFNYWGCYMRVHSFGKTISLLMLLFALSQVVSCGQKGDLYLPDEQQSSITPASLFIAALA